MTFHRKFVVSQCQKTSWRNPSVCSVNFWYRKISSKRWGKEGVSRFSVKRILTHSAKELRGGKLRCSRKVLVSNTFVDDGGGERERERERGGRGSVTTFCQMFVVSLYRKTP